MRTCGSIPSPVGLRPGDHLCWVYDDPDRFAADVVAFLQEGLDRSERIAVVTDAPVADTMAALRPLGDVGELVRHGTLAVSSVTEAYPGHHAPAETQVDRYAALTDAALADGYRGLRVAADITPLVADPAGRRAFARYEHLIDRYMAAHPFTALCGYDERVVGGYADEIAHLHPAGNRADLPFRLVGGPAGSVRVAGEVDALSAAAFRSALGHVVEPDAAHLLVDGADLTFIDHRGLFALAAAAPQVELVTRFSGAATLVELLGLQPSVKVQVER